MNDDPREQPVGVHGIDADGHEQLVHEYTDEDYGLDHVHLVFGLGRLESRNNGIVLVLHGNEIRQLKAMADAQSFDHPADFIAMCLDIHRFASGRGPGPFRFRADP